MATKLKNIHIDFRNVSRTADWLAVKQVKTIPEGFMVVADNKHAVPESLKVHWEKLNRKSNGVLTPHDNVSWITRRFNELAKDGWTVVRNK